VDAPEQERALRERWSAEPHLCTACAAIGREQERFEKMPHDPHGLHWVVTDEESRPD